MGCTRQLRRSGDVPEATHTPFEQWFLTGVLWFFVVFLLETFQFVPPLLPPHIGRGVGVIFLDILADPWNPLGGVVPYFFLL